MEKTIENLKTELKNISEAKNRSAHLDVAATLLNAAVERIGAHVAATKPVPAETHNETRK